MQQRSPISPRGVMPGNIQRMAHHRFPAQQPQQMLGGIPVSTAQNPQQMSPVADIHQAPNFPQGSDQREESSPSSTSSQQVSPLQSIPVTGATIRIQHQPIVVSSSGGSDASPQGQAL